MKSNFFIYTGILLAITSCAKPLQTANSFSQQLDDTNKIHVLIYSTAKNKATQTALDYLNQQHIPFKFIDINTADGQREFIKAKLKKANTVFPVMKVCNHWSEGWQQILFQRTLTSCSVLQSDTTQCDNQQILSAKKCSGDEINNEENELYQIINDYREHYQLEKIPLSPSLNLVANRHVHDLAENIHNLTHGWSNCDYNANNRTCMWQQPQTLKTAYPGKGYEIAFEISEGFEATADVALNTWQHSTGHNNVILNQGVWTKSKWRALGVGIYKRYAVVWFGEEKDKQ